MKSLKFMLAAATAIGLATASQAAGPLAGSTSFEDFSGNITAQTDSNLFVVPNGAEEGDYTIVTEGVVNSDAAVRSAGAKGKWATNSKALKLEGGTDPLEVKVAKNAVGEDVPADGLYVDTLVQFTVTPAGDTVEAGSSDKLMIYLKEDLTVGSESTNLYAKAYGWDGEGTPVAGGVDYKLLLPTGVSVVPGTWYRLTVKALQDVGGNDGEVYPGFQVFINDGLCTIEGGDWANNPGMGQEAPGNYLISLLADGSTAAKLVSVGFAGSGMVDDVLVTTFAPGVTAIDFTLILDDSVSGINGAVTFSTSLETDTELSGTVTGYRNGVSDLIAMTYTLKPGFEASWSNGTTGTGSETFSIAAGGTNTLTVSRSFVAPDFTLNGGVTPTYANGVYTLTAPAGFVIGSLLVNGTPDPAAVGQTSYNWTEVSGAIVTVTAMKAAAAHPWYESPAAVVLASDLPHQGENGESDGQWVSAFHGQGEGEYLGLTYSTNGKRFDLYQVDGTNALTTLRSIPVGDTGAGFRGVAISKTLGIAMTLAYATTTKMLAYPLAGGDPTEVVKPSTHSFDAGAFSPDGAYFFSNALNGESDNKYYVKWSVAVANGVVTLTKVGSITAGGRGRCMAYARINGRDLVFGLVDTSKVVVMDMTGDDSSAWTKTDMLTGLPAHSYGTLCVSGVDIYGTTPHLTVATSINNGATKADVLNVYALTVPASGTVTASLVKSFDEDALTDAYFGDISDASRYGNTVYVTDDEKTIYFARPDNKLYAAEYATYYTNTFISGEGSTTNVTLIAEGRTEPGRGPVTPAEVTGKSFSAWDPAVVPAVADALYTAVYAFDNYTISYLYEDGSAFTDWDSGATITTSYTIEDAVTLPVAADVDLQVVGVSFGGWTNETGTVTGWAAGQTGNVTVYAKLDAVVAPSYPTYAADADATVKANYDAWKTTNGADTESAYENQFLLNTAPATAVPNTALAITEIKENTTAGWDIVVECTVSGVDLSGEVGTAKAGNGYLAVSYAASLAGPWTTENIDITASANGKVTVNVNKSGAKFMKVKLTTALESVE